MEPLTGYVYFEYHGYGEEEGGSWTNLIQVSVSANSLTRQQRLERYTSYTTVEYFIQLSINPKSLLHSQQGPRNYQI